jgi:hypothetical protein
MFMFGPGRMANMYAPRQVEKSDSRLYLMLSITHDGDSLHLEGFYGL